MEGKKNKISMGKQQGSRGYLSQTGSIQKEVKASLKGRQWEGTQPMEGSLHHADTFQKLW